MSSLVKLCALALPSAVPLVARIQGVSRGPVVLSKLIHSRHEQMSLKSHVLISNKSSSLGVSPAGETCLLPLSQNKMKSFSLLP